MKKIDAALFGLAIILMGALVYSSNPLAIARSIAMANPVFIAAIMAMTASEIFLKIFKWRMLLQSVGITRGMNEIRQPFLASLFLSNMTPGRVGEPVRSYYLKKKTGDSISKSLPTIVAERILDMLTIIFFSFIGVFSLSGVLPKNTLFGVALVLFGMVTILAISVNKRMLSLSMRIFFSIFSFSSFVKRMERHLEKFLNNFSEGFRQLGKSRNLPGIMALTLLVWLMEVASLYFAFMSVGVALEPAFVLSAFGVSMLVGLLTFLPGAMGSFEASMAFIMTHASQVSLPLTLAGLLIYRAGSLWFALLLCSKSFFKNRI